MSKYDRVMKKCERFYNHPKPEEVYNLDCSITEFLIPRLKLFLDKSSKIVDWDFHKEHDHIYMEHDVRQMIRKLEYIKENSFSWDEKTMKKCDKYAHEVCDKLGELYFYLWY